MPPNFSVKHTAAIRDAATRAMDYRSATAVATASSSALTGAQHDCAALPAYSQASFALNGTHFVLRTDQPLAAAIAVSAYARLRAATPASPYVVATISGGEAGVRAQFQSKSATYSHALGTFGTAYAGVRDVFAAFIRVAASGSVFYGGCFALEGNAVAVFGESGIGKTVLLLHLAQAGARFLGDETFMLRSIGGTLCAVPRLPALREPSLPMLPEALRESVSGARAYAATPRGKKFWYALDGDDLAGITPDATAHLLSAAIFIERRSAQPALRALSQHELMHRAAERLHEKPRSLADLARLRRALHGVRAYALDLGDPAQTAQLITDNLPCR
jgi:hypothetical protein